MLSKAYPVQNSQKDGEVYRGHAEGVNQRRTVLAPFLLRDEYLVPTALMRRAQGVVHVRPSCQYNSVTYVASVVH